MYEEGKAEEVAEEGMTIEPHIRLSDGHGSISGESPVQKAANGV